MLIVTGPSQKKTEVLGEADFIKNVREVRGSKRGRFEFRPKGKELIRKGFRIRKSYWRS